MIEIEIRIEGLPCRLYGRRDELERLARSFIKDEFAVLVSEIQVDPSLYGDVGSTSGLGCTVHLATRSSDDPITRWFESLGGRGDD